MPSAAQAKAKRTATLSDDEVKANITESYFRTGWPCLVPYPAEHRWVRDPAFYMKDYEKQLETFGNILSAQNVPYTNIRLVDRFTTGNFEQSYPTLLIDASSQTGSWYNAVLRLVRSLENTYNEYDGLIHVEIMEQGYHDPCVLPIPVDDGILSTWPIIGASIIDTLSQLNAQWRLLSLVNLGCRFEGKQTVKTIILEVWDPENVQWESRVLPRLKAMVADSTIVNVELWKAGESLNNRGVTRDVYHLPERTWDTNMHIGDGLGPKGSPTLGTLGGFFRIKNQVENEPTACILTNFHVVSKCPGLVDRLISPAPDSPSPLRSLDFLDSPPLHEAISPTESDVDKKREALEKELTAISNILCSSHCGPSVALKAQLGDQRAADALAAREEEIEALKARLSSLSDLSKFRAGFVRAVSGYQYLFRNNRKIALDWALLHVDPERSYSTSFPRDNDREMDLDLPSWAWLDFKYWKKASTFKTGRVMKVGRGSGWTSGQINYAQVWLNLKQEARGALWVQEYGTIVECMRVETINGLTKPFSVGGDSGSMVLDESSGACIGLLFGGGRAETYGLMTPIEDVIKSIEDVTNCRVVEPELST